MSARFFFHFAFTFVTSENNGKYANVAAARFYGHKLHFVITLLSFCFFQRRFFLQSFRPYFFAVVSNEQPKKFLFTSLAFQKKRKKKEMK